MGCAIFSQLVPIFGPFWVIFGPFWVIFGPFWQFWVIFGPILAILGHLWAILGNFRSFWAIFWCYFFVAKYASVLFKSLFATLDIYYDLESCQTRKLCFVCIPKCNCL